MNKRDLRVGQKVLPNPQHEDYEKYNHQFDGIGTIIEVYPHDTYYDCNVKWINGATYSYKAGMFTLADESQKEDEEVNQDIKKGMRVKVNPAHSDTKMYEGQHGYYEGTVVAKSSGDRFDAIVRWDNGNQNCYNSAMLLPVETIISEDGQTVEAEKEEKYIYPLLPGQRVCLNPEHRLYADMLKKTKDTAGYIVDPQFSDDSLKAWKRYRSTAGTAYAKIKLDNGKIVSLMYEQLTLIDAPVADVERVEIEGVYFYAINGEVTESERATMDNYAIKHGWRIDNKKSYDQEWRNMIIQAIDKGDKRPTPKREEVTF